MCVCVCEERERVSEVWYQGPSIKTSSQKKANKSERERERELRPSGGVESAEKLEAVKIHQTLNQKAVEG